MKSGHFPLAILVLGLVVSDRGLAGDKCAELQYPDHSFVPQVEEPAFPDADGNAPLAVIDEAHNNLHTAHGRLRPFARLLEEDGYSVESSEGRYSTFTKAKLKQVDVLVIANALNSVNLDKESCADQWKLPTPSAFEQQEITSLAEWVKEGGSLLLLADHFTFPGAAEDLAAAFGLILTNGYTYPVDIYAPIEFSTTDGSLRSHPIISGRAGKGEEVNSVLTFTGQAIRARPMANVQPLMVLGEGVRTFFPLDLDAASTDFVQNLMTSPYISSEGLMQGAAVEFGEGRVVLLGEAGMFTAQRLGQQRMGMSHPGAKQNAQFALNVMHWLSGLL